MVLAKRFSALYFVMALITLSGCAMVSNFIPESEEARQARIAQNEQMLADIKAKQERDQKAYSDAFNKCDKMPWTKKTAYEKQGCLNKAESINPTNYYGGTLLETINNANLKAALDYAEGKTSLERFLLTKQDIALKVKSHEEEQRRQQVEVQIRQFQEQQEAERQRKAAAWQQFGQVMQQQNLINQQNAYQQQMLMQQNRMKTTNCNAFGNTVNCTTY